MHRMFRFYLIHSLRIHLTSSRYPPDFLIRKDIRNEAQVLRVLDDMKRRLPKRSSTKGRPF